MAAATGFLGQIFGDKPTTPRWDSLGPTTVQDNTIAGNLEVLPKAEKLASQVNLFNVDQVNAMLSATIPDFNEIMSTVSGNIASMTRGELPQDVVDQIQNFGASKGFGSEFSRNFTAKDLGLTSLNLTNAGMGAAQSWLNSVKSLTPTMDVTSMFLSPQQRWGMETSERYARWQVEWLREQIKSMPNPAAVGMEGWISSGLGMASSAASSYMNKPNNSGGGIDTSATIWSGVKSSAGGGGGGM